MARTTTDLSLRLYDVMDKVGASEFIRSLHRHATTTQEIMLDIEYDLKDIGMTTHVFGSFCEGTTTVGLQSDIDRLETMDRNPVIERLPEAPSFGLSHRLVREKGTYPGYVKLQPVINRIPMTVRFGEVDLAEYDMGSTRNIYRRHKPHPISGYYERNGPADTYRFESGLSLDKVVALETATIPQFAEKFLSRHRPRQWPSRKELITMRTLGCFFVGVGHPNSPEFETEWRLSLSKQERMLMFNLNAVQHRCYVLLKIIKKELIEGKLGKSFSSYHCKTCLFHVIEHTPDALWKPECLRECVILCLTTLYQWTYNVYCPNFFIPEENMFDRTVFRLKRRHILQTLQELISDKDRFFFNLQTDNVGELLTSTILEPLVKVETDKQYCRLTSFTIEEVLHTDPRNYKVNFHGVKSGTHHPALVHFKVFDWVSNIKCVRGKSKADTKKALAHFVPLLHLNLALCLISLWFCTNNHQASINLIKAFDYHYQKALAGYSVVSVKLVLATVLYRIGKYKECEELLLEVETDFKPYVAPLCACQERMFKSIYYHWKKLNPDSFSLNTRMLLQNATAPCVQFTHSDLEIIPTALQYEMFRSGGAPPGTRREDADYWYDMAVVDARVYLYFLQYLVFSKLQLATKKYSALKKLRKAACSQNENVGHRETAFNLLGWIYLQEGQIHKALDWFVMSWRLKPHHNAAKWHVRQVMARLNVPGAAQHPIL